MNVLSWRRGPSTPDRSPAEDLEVWWFGAIAGTFETDPERIARVRRTVLAGYRARAEGRPERAPGHHRLLRPGAKWIVALAAAAALILAAVGFAAAEDGPGQPFYGLRLTVESLTLPPVGSAGRLQAQLALLDSRLSETKQAGQRGDAGAAEAALAAYDARLAEILADGTDPSLVDVLSRDEVVLTGLMGELPAAAQAGLQRALDQVSRARASFHGPPPLVPGGGSGPGTGGGPGNGGGPAPAGGSRANPGNAGGPGNRGGSGGAGAPSHNPGSGGSAGRGNGNANEPRPSHPDGKP